MNEHLDHPVVITIDHLREVWSDVDDDTRAHMISSIIWMSANASDFHSKIVSYLTSTEFRETL